MRNNFRSLFPSIAITFTRLAAVAFALTGAVACSSATNSSAASSGMDLALLGSSEAKTNVHVLLKSNGKDGEKRDVALDVNGAASESFTLEPGEHVMAIVCTDEEGNELLGTGVATFETNADTKLMILVDIDSLIDGEEVPEELIEEVAEANGAVDVDANADADADADANDDEGETGASVDADANVNVNADEGEVDADANANANANADASAGDANVSADANADADGNGANATADASATAESDDASANATASAGVAVVSTTSTNGDSDDEAECDEVCQAECLEELLDLCGF